MSNNPWQIRKPRASRHQAQQSAQNRQTSGEANPHQPLPQAGFTPPPTQTDVQTVLSPSPQQRQSTSHRKPSPYLQPLPLLLALAFVVLGIFLLRATLNYAGAKGEYQTLVNQRAEEDRRKQAHKDEHLNARANSGFLALVRKYAAEYQVSPSFVSAIIKCESSFNPRAVSRVDARGLMQIMPDTGPWLAERLKMTDYQAQMLFDPETNIRLGVSYLAYLSDVFSGNPVMVAAAYHAGDNNVKRWALNHAQDQKTITLEQIPTDDTRSYVRKVMDAYAIYYQEDQQDKGNPVLVVMPAAGTAQPGAGN